MPHHMRRENIERFNYYDTKVDTHLFVLFVHSLAAHFSVFLKTLEIICQNLKDLYVEYELTHLPLAF